MSSRHQDPDDTTCTPCRFRRYEASDGSIEKTFNVRRDWSTGKSGSLGELIVRETATGPLLKITREE